MLQSIYNKLPVFVQNMGLSLYGYRVMNQRYKGNFHAYIQEIQQDEQRSKEEIEVLQRLKLTHLLQYVDKYVPYYADLFKECGVNPTGSNPIAELKKIPFLLKNTIKENSERFISTEYKKSQLIEYPTGGTTGSPLILYKTADEIQYNFAMAEVRMKQWFGVKTGDKVATFLGKLIVPIENTKPPFWRKNWAYNQTLYSTFHMSQENLQYYVEELRRQKPELIIGYVTPVYMIAKYLVENKIQDIKVNAIFTSSETLFANQREVIEKAFSARVCNQYGQAEGVSFISECREGGLHVSPEFAFIEFIPTDEKNTYEVVGTTLFSLAMPLLRYKTHDLVVIEDFNATCKCGRELYPLVKEILGRRDNVITARDKRVISSAPLSLVFQSCPHLVEAQIIQPDYDNLILNLVTEKGFSDKNKEYLLGELRKRVGFDFKIEIQYLERIPRTESGKFRFIISNVK